MVSAAAAGLNLVLLVGLLHALYRLLGAEVVGKWALISAIFGIARVAECGTGVAVARLVAARSPGDPPAGAWVATALLLVALVGAAGTSLVGVVLFFLRPELFSDAGGAGLITYACVFATLASILMSPLRGGLDGLQKIEARQMATVAQPAALLATALAVVPALGERGFAWSLAGSAAAALAIYGYLFWRALPNAERRLKPSVTVLRRLLKVGLPVQAGSACQYLYEPLTKALLEAYSGLAAVASFEMVNRLVVQIRGLLITAMEPLVPYFARTASENPKASANSYEVSKQMTALFAAPVFTVTIFLLPAMSLVLTREIDPRQVLMGTLLALAWLVNTLSAPAYMFLVSTGGQRQAFAGQALIAAGNLLFGVFFGVFWGATGVICAWSIALITGSVKTISYCNSMRPGETGRFGFMFRPLRVVLGAAVVVTSLTYVQPDLRWQFLAFASGVVWVLVDLSRQKQIREVAGVILGRFLSAKV